MRTKSCDAQCLGLIQGLAVPLACADPVRTDPRRWTRWHIRVGKERKKTRTEGGGPPF